MFVAIPVSIITGLIGLYLWVRGIRFTQALMDDRLGTSGLGLGGTSQAVGVSYMLATMFNLSWFIEGTVPEWGMPIWVLLLISFFGVGAGIIYGALLRLIPRDGLDKMWRGVIKRAQPLVPWQSIPFEDRLSVYAAVVGGMLLSAVRAFPS